MVRRQVESEDQLLYLVRDKKQNEKNLLSLRVDELGLVLGACANGHCPTATAGTCPAPVVDPIPWGSVCSGHTAHIAQRYHKPS